MAQPKPYRNDRERLQVADRHLKAAANAIAHLTFADSQVSMLGDIRKLRTRIGSIQRERMPRFPGQEH